MMIIKCTSKLQKEMGLKKADLFSTESTHETLLRSWFANLIYIARRKCVLFVNDETLFNFIVTDLNREHIKKLDAIFKANLSCNLSEEGINNRYLECILSKCNDTKYSKTDNKKMLGSMNNLAYHYEMSILDAGGVHSYQIPEIIKNLNRMPMSAIKYKYPIDAFNKQIKNLS